MSADDYVVDITGDGAISANASDIANAERDRGIQNLTISGFASKTLGNFDNVVIKYAGGKGKDKTFTITEGSIAVTKTFTTAQWDDAKATGRLLNFDHQFASGTHINFDVDFDEIDDVPDTAGVGTSVIEKNVNVAVSTTNLNGIGQRIERSAPQPVGPAEAGQRRERLRLRFRHAAHDGRRAHHPAGRGLQRDRRAGLWPRVRSDRRHADHPDRRASTGIANDFTYSLTASATAADFNFVTGTFGSYAATLVGPNGGVTTTVSASGTYTFSAAADDTARTSRSTCRPPGFQGIVRAAASSVGARQRHRAGARRGAARHRGVADQHSAASPTIWRIPCRSTSSPPRPRRPSR